MEGLFRAMSKQAKNGQAVLRTSELGEILSKMAAAVLFESADRTGNVESLVEQTSPLSDLFRYLGLCVASLAESGKPCSLFAADHLSKKRFTSLSSAKFVAASDTGGDPVRYSSSGDILFSILGVAAPLHEAGRDVRKSVLEAISVVVLQAREGYRPVYVLVALAIVGAHSSDSRMITVAARALFLAATLVKAAAEVEVEEGDVLPVTAKEIVAVAPVGMVALTSKHKVGRCVVIG